MQEFRYITSFSRAGGGGSSSSHSSSSSSSHSSSSSSYRNSSSSSSGGNSGGIGSLIFFLLFFGVFAVIIILIIRSSMKAAKARVAKAKAGIDAAASKDAAWQDTTLQARTQDIFQKFESDWCSKNLEGIQSYTTKEYFAHMQLVVTAMRNLGRTNKMEDVKLISANPVIVNDQADNQNDSFTAEIIASAKDMIIDDTAGKTLHEDNSSFTEYWHFYRQGDQWLLGGISQSTEDAAMLSPKLQGFASSNGFFYSPDWGWLLLPLRGQLFSSATFGNSDINNHVVGLYRNILVEFYDYIPNKNIGAGYTIAQASLPKTYGDIVVRRSKSKVFGGKIKGLTKVETEWQDFNKKYEVFASDIERVTSFELLNPVYMEKLESLSYEVSIEVVDNVVYLFTKDNQASYDDMLVVLKQAFDEMKL